LPISSQTFARGGERRSVRELRISAQAAEHIETLAWVGIHKRSPLSVDYLLPGRMMRCADGWRFARGEMKRGDDGEWKFVPAST
jgi:hypothetical protein